MSKIVFFGIPAHGHTNPTLEVVRELIDRGNQVWYYSYEFLREKIQSAGAIFVSCDGYDAGQNLTAKDAARIGSDLAFSTKILVDTTLALDDKLCAEMRQLQPDCIVADSMAVWGKAIAIKLGIPFVCSTTTFAFNQHAAKIMKQTAGELLRMLLSMPKVSRQLKRLQKKGYPIKNIFDILSSDNNTHTIVYTSPEFQPCSETFSNRFAFVGPSVRPAVESITKTADKLVYISMGTVNNDLMPLYKQCIAAFADAPVQVILSVGDVVCIEEFGTLPANISVFPHVDQIAVLQQADVFVSHCGMNSASESLYFGVPLVTLPQTTEQGGVAARVLQLGAGIKPEKADAPAIFTAVTKALTDESFRQNADLIRKGFLRCPGAKGAADKIMGLC